MRAAPALLAIAALACSPAGDIGATRSALDLDAWGAAASPIPSDVVLLEELVEAVELRQRRELDRLLDAREPGELLEHGMLEQGSIDRLDLGNDAFFVFGDDLFELMFRPEHGLGNGLAGRPGIPAASGAPPNLRRVHDGEFGGPDALACASCHSQGGLDGAGANSQNAFFRGDGERSATADQRNPPALLGLGPIEALATEMSADLAALREQVIASALASGAPAEVDLETHGVSFGVLRSDATGRLDVDGVAGIDRDLVVRPFGWKGHQATIRAIATESFRVHMGIVSVNDQERAARGELAAATFGDGAMFDIDLDGTSVELEDGMLTTISVYLAMLEVPVISPPSDPLALERFARGGVLIDELGCTSCHRRRLVLRDPVIEIRPDHPAFADSATIRVDVAHEGEAPKIEQRTVFETVYDVPLFSDLRRHEMGPELSSMASQGSIPASVFLTRPLWGVAVSAPYLHDGRAPTVADAILLHGGEALASRDAFAAASGDDRAALLTFLAALTRVARIQIP